MAVGGEAAATTPDGAVVLVAGGAPGERLRIGDVRRSGGVLRGRIEEVLSASDERRSPSCPLLDRCGGCPWMHLTEGAQARLKAGFVHDALLRSGAVRQGGVTVEFHDAPAGLGWRRRARLRWTRGKLGFRGRRSRQVTDVPTCGVLTPALDAALKTLRTMVVPHLQGEGEVRLALGPSGASVILRPEGDQPANLYAACERLAEAPGVAGVELVDAAAGSAARWGAVEDVMTTADGLGLRAAAGGFSQANDAVNQALVAVVAELADPGDASVLELYSGAGNLTAMLAAKARRYVAVESDAEAVQACRDNLARRGIRGVKLHVADASAPVAGRFDVVVLDPPRTGAKDALPVVLNARPKRIVYVSCDPKTLQRDLTLLAAQGWEVTAAHGFDMFPQTAHVEAAVRLDRRA